MSEIVDRIRQIIAYKKVSERQFCKEIGVANGFLSKVSDVGCAKLNKILYTYPEIDPVWLLTGKGDMIAGNRENPNNPTIVYQQDPRDSELIELQRYKIKHLEGKLQEITDLNFAHGAVISS